MSDEAQHSAEPWWIGIRAAYEMPSEYEILDAGDEVIGEMAGPRRRETALRLVLCVNALAGIPSEAIAAGIISDKLEERGYLAGERWLTERDRMAAEIERLTSENVAMRYELERLRLETSWEAQVIHSHKARGGRVE